MLQRAPSGRFHKALFIVLFVSRHRLCFHSGFSDWESAAACPDQSNPLYDRSCDPLLQSVQHSQSSAGISLCFSGNADQQGAFYGRPSFVQRSIHGWRSIPAREHVQLHFLCLQQSQCLSPSQTECGLRDENEVRGNDAHPHFGGGGRESPQGGGAYARPRPQTGYAPGGWRVVPVAQERPIGASVLIFTAIHTHPALTTNFDFSYSGTFEDSKEKKKIFFNHTIHSIIWDLLLIYSCFYIWCNLLEFLLYFHAIFMNILISNNNKFIS